MAAVAAVSCARGVQAPRSAGHPSPSVTAPSWSVPPPGKPWPPNLEGKELNFPSIDRAVTFLETRMDTPIVLPMGMPSDIALDTTQGPGSLVLFTVAGQRSAQLRLTAGHGLHLTIQYGVALLD